MTQPAYPIPRPWAKIRRDATGTITAFLSLADHAADVGAVAEALLGLPTIRRRLARLGGLDDLTEVQVARLAVLAALHDLGKVNHGFQAKALPPGSAGVDISGHIQCFWILWDKGGETWLMPLDDAGLEQAREWFDPDPGDEFAGLNLALRAVLNHHGGLCAKDDSSRIDARLWQARAGHDPLAAATAVVRATRAWFPAAFGPAERNRLPLALPFWHGFAGLVTLADRLGSDESVFGLSGDRNIPQPDETRIAFARRMAAQVLDARFLRPGHTRAAARALPWDFADLFGFPMPQPAQRMLLEAPDPPPGGSLVLLEAETGSGKTEAALLHFLRLFRLGLVDGMVFALPTRAAAEQIHRRIHKILTQDWFPAAAPPVVLAVPGYLRVDDKDGLPLPHFRVQWPDDENGSLRDRGWAAEHSSRYLAGAIVVGTVDQVLLAALDVKDARLRAAALLRHLLVVDEVHASDSYMVVLLTHILRLHQAAGGHALLMSATLGEDARAGLLAARTGLSWRKPLRAPLAEAVARPYPALDGIELSPVMAPEPQSRRSRRVAVELWPDIDDRAGLVNKALAAARQGARVLVIVNTVRRAMAFQQALTEAADKAGCTEFLFRLKDRPCLHHARFAAEDRKRLDQALEKAFGKASRNAVVAITTQTAEQSLDIDADLLITDLCPADVLLQRIGRLHRHPERDEARPADVKTPRVVVMAPTLERMSEALDHPSRLGLGFGLVYANMAGLAATRRELEDRREIVIPRDNRALVEAATHPEALGKLVEQLGGGWPKSLQALWGDDNSKKSLACHHLLQWDKEFRAIDRELETAARTRLGAADAMVRLPADTRGPFGEKISSLKIPGWMLEAAPTTSELDAPPAQPAPDTLSFHFAGTAFVYDRLGLRPESGP